MKGFFRLLLIVLSATALFNLAGCSSGTSNTTGASSAYVANESGNQISMYTVPGTGSLTPVTSLSLNGSFVSLALTPDGNHMYAVDSANGIIDLLNRSADGSLTSNGTTALAAGAQPTAAAIDSGGKFLFISNSGGQSVSVFAINSANGGLTEVAGSPFATPGNAVSVAVSSSAKYVYVTAQNPSAVYAFTLNSSTGALTSVPGSPLTAATNPSFTAVAPSFTAVAPNETFLCVTDPVGGLLYAYNIDPATGALTQSSFSPFTAVTEPIAAMFDSTSTYLFVAGQLGGVSAITFTPAVTQVSSATVGGTPVYIALSPSGTGLYVVNKSGDFVSQFSVSGGTITAMTTATVATGTTPSWIVLH